FLQIQDQQAKLRQYEYSSLVKIHSWSEVPRSEPLFRNLLVFENYPVNRLGGGDSYQESAPSSYHTFEKTNYPLNICVSNDLSFMLRCMYDRNWYDDNSITRLVNHLGMMLESVVADMDVQIGQLSFMTEAERYQLLVEWNQAPKKYPDQGLVELF